MGVTANTFVTFAFLRRELDDIGIVLNPTKTLRPPPKWHAPTTEDSSLLESTEVCILD